MSATMYILPLDAREGPLDIDFHLARKPSMKLDFLARPKPNIARSCSGPCLPGLVPHAMLGPSPQHDGWSGTARKLTAGLIRPGTWGSYKTPLGSRLPPPPHTHTPNSSSFPPPAPSRLLGSSPPSSRALALPPLHLQPPPPPQSCSPLLRFSPSPPSPVIQSPAPVRSPALRHSQISISFSPPPTFTPRLGLSPPLAIVLSGLGLSVLVEGCSHPLRLRR